MTRGPVLYIGSPMSNTTIGGEPGAPTRYKILSRIGGGGMAEVFLGVMQGPGGYTKLVVLKRIWPELASDPAFVSMFLGEARLAARLQHPNVVHTYEIGQEGD